MQSPPLWQELSRIAGWPLRAPGRHRPACALARLDSCAWSDTVPEARFLDEAPEGALGAPALLGPRLCTQLRAQPRQQGRAIVGPAVHDHR